MTAAAGCRLAGTRDTTTEVGLLDGALLVAGQAGGVDGDIDDVCATPLSRCGHAPRLVGVAGLAGAGLATGHWNSRC